jgi:hypothetical protein
VIHIYHRVARELWTFCWGIGADPEFVAALIGRQTTESPADWWQCGAPGERAA